MNLDYVLLGQNVRALRKKQGLSQEQLAERCDISTSFMGLIERGDRKMSLETLMTLVDALETTPDALLLDQMPPSRHTACEMVRTLKFASPHQEEGFLNALRALIKGADEF